MSEVLPNVFFALCGAYVGVVTLYLLTVTVAAHFPRRTTLSPPAGPISFAVVIPAHNEAGQIEQTVAAVCHSDYLGEWFSIYVIADNCDDDTAAMARSAGADVLERFDGSKRGKGQALDWCFRMHRSILEHHDAVAIIDADAAVAPGFLAAMAKALAQPGVHVVQANNAVANPEANWRTALTYAGFALVNRVRTAGRFRLGGSAGLKGNGMAFRSDLLIQYGWPAHSIAEDVEFDIHLLLDGHRVALAPDALITSDMPMSRGAADTQRNRWESGRMRIAAAYVPVLLWACLRRPKWRYADAALDLLVPPLAALVLGQMGLTVAAALFRPGWLPLFVVCAVATALHVVLGLHLSRAPRRVWFALAAVPFFLLWKAGLYLRLLAGAGEKQWVRTARESEAGQEGTR